MVQSLTAIDVGDSIYYIVCLVILVAIVTGIGWLIFKLMHRR